MIRIEVSDPANTPASELRAVISLLQHYAGSTAIAAADLPSAGSLTPAEAFSNSPSAEQAFAAVPTPEAAFAPNVPPAPFIAGAVPSMTAPVGLLSISTLPVSAPVMTAPMPASAAPIAAAPVAPAPPAPGVEVDAAGLPWDARIHAKSSDGPGGVKIADGTWRSKRGVDTALKAQVEGQLRQVMGAPAPAAIPNAAPTQSTASPSALAGVAPAFAPSAGGIDNYVMLVQAVAGATAAGKLTQAEVDQVCVFYGMPGGLPLLVSRPDLVPSVMAHVNNIIAARA